MYGTFSATFFFSSSTLSATFLALEYLFSHIFSRLFFGKNLVCKVGCGTPWKIKSVNGWLLPPKTAQSAQNCPKVSRASKSAQNGLRVPRVAKPQKFCLKLFSRTLCEQQYPWRAFIFSKLWWHKKDMDDEWSNILDSLVRWYYISWLECCVFLICSETLGWSTIKKQLDIYFFSSRSLQDKLLSSLELDRHWGKK